jgi:predicted TIM-barrel fold metal-dependent hydrolase
LMDRSWNGISPDRYLDTHVHIVGIGSGNSGCWVNPKVRDVFGHPMERTRFEIYRMAAGVEDLKRADQEWVQRLLDLVQSPLVGGRVLILAFDQVYDVNGQPQPEASQFHTPNQYVLDLAREHPGAFVPVASVHPYRPDAIEALEAAVEGGAVAVKWLPNAQVIDPAAPSCARFYEHMARHGLPLITHAGEELAVDSAEHQALANPLRLRAALDRGVDVVAAHCASLGEDLDLDAGPEAPPTSSFALWKRLVRETLDRGPGEGRMWGDISALTQINRSGEPLEQVLQSQDLHPRLVNGSDYPLPAINALVFLDYLRARELIDPADVSPLREIYRHNALAFDLALKRAIGFPAALFEAGSSLFLP